MKKALCTVFVFVLLLSALPADSDPLFLWKTRIAECDVFMTGTIHILDKNFYPLPVALLDAVESTDVLVLEVEDPSNVDQEVLTAVARHGFYSTGPGLMEQLPSDLAALVKRRVRRYGLDMTMIDRFRPWYLAMMLPAMEYLNSGQNAEMGMDVWLYQLRTYSEVIGLETADEQLSLFYELEDQEQIILLRNTLVDLDSADDVLRDAVDAWQTGDLSAMEEVLSSGEVESELEELERQILDERNLRMVDRLVAALDGRDERVFLAVGAGHFPGEEGILEILHRRGYGIEQVMIDGSLVPWP